MKKDYFEHKSKSWDMNSRRVKNAKSIANLIKKEITLHKDMLVMDLGAGTGLLSFFISEDVDSIIALDNSLSMLNEFKKKSNEFLSRTDIVYGDILEYNPTFQYDLIISSMTIHHIKETFTLFEKLYSITKDGGYIAIADLDLEDGTFHSEDTGVHHFGFDREVLEKIAKDVGFKDIKIQTASTIEKPHKNFSLFLLTAKK